VGDATRLEVGDVEDSAGRGHRGGKGEEGTSGELHFDGFWGKLLVRLKSWDGYCAADSDADADVDENKIG
jgi:hypothetical protein